MEIQERENRRLAHIEQINWIREIPGADRIVTYGILGWEVVDQKGKYNIGDKIIYCEIDSVLPDKPEYEFLRDRKFRIRTIKLKGQVSMGLILPLSILDTYVKEKGGLKFIKSALQPGDDVTNYLGITKYLTPSEREEIKKVEVAQNRLTKFMMRYSWFRRLFLSRHQKKGFPYWFSKTDEPRLQNLDFQRLMQEFGDKEVYITEKIDYQNGNWSMKKVPRFNNWFGIKMFNLINKL